MKTMILFASMILMSSFAVAGDLEVSACASKSATKLDFISMIANSEAIGMQAGGNRDVSAIEVFAVSSGDLMAKANITFSDINQIGGNSAPVTYNVRLNCDADGGAKIELE